jgi:hypothetical protein
VLETPFSYAIITVVSFMQGDYASLDFCGTLDQAKVPRVSPPMRRGEDCVMGFYNMRSFALLWMTTFYRTKITIA